MASFDRKLCTLRLMEILGKFGLNIQQKKGKNPGYYISARNFELPELKLLVDAVQSSKFITEKKSKELITKLEKHWKSVRMIA